MHTLALEANSGSHIPSAPLCLQAHEHAPELYKACPRWCLNWSVRGPGILAEITHWDPDIGLLQEVDRVAQFQSYLQQRGCAEPNQETPKEHVRTLPIRGYSKKVCLIWRIIHV